MLRSARVVDERSHRPHRPVGDDLALGQAMFEPDQDESIDGVERGLLGRRGRSI